MLGKICRAAAEERLTVALETLVDKPYRLVTSLETLGAALLDVGESKPCCNHRYGYRPRNGEDIDTSTCPVSVASGDVHLTNLSRDISPSGLGGPAWAVDPQDLLRRFACAGYTGDAALEIPSPHISKAVGRALARTYNLERM